MNAHEVLADLNFGNSVAEFDDDLDSYFVETQSFRTLVEGRADIIAGDKGTGKTALFRILNSRYTQIGALSTTEMVPAFNPAGSPIFQRLVEQGVEDEGRYINLWKAYILALVGNWALDFAPDIRNDIQNQLYIILERLDLLSADDSPSTIFSRVSSLFRRLATPKSIEMGITMLPHGMPVVVPKIELGDPEPPNEAAQVPFEEAFRVLDAVLAEMAITTWIVFDRLDEAFQAAPQVEIPALRALLRTYLDLIPYEHLRLKLFVRRDLFRRITEGGFVNLTHINARKLEITWDEDDLWDLLLRRLRKNETFLSRIGLSEDRAEEAWAVLVPEQVDPGARKPKTWTWIMRRIRDGNDVHPPRNLIDLLRKAQSVQLRRDEQRGRDFPTAPLLTSDSLKRGLSALSEERVQDTLIAEAGDVAKYLDMFRGGKAEHNVESLSKLLDLKNSTLITTAQSLTEMGFLEKIGGTYKVPSLYRDGLRITQGKAFLEASEKEVAQEDED
jgi:hypothetical protein